MSLLKPFSGLVLLLLLSSPTLAKEVTLHEALRAAIRQRPQALAARADARAAREDAQAARAHLLPRLSLQENFLITDEPAASLFIDLNQESLELSNDAGAYNFAPTRHDFETRLTLDQPLFDPELWYGRRRARAGARAAAASAAWSAEEAAFAAFRAYLQLQQAAAARQWARSSQEQALETERRARERYQAGVGLKADHLRARVALSESERRVLAADNDLILARHALAIAMGQPGSEPSVAAPVGEDLFLETPTGPVDARADLAALQHRVQQNREAVAQSRGAYWPRWNLSASYALHDGDAPFGTDAGSWRLWTGLSWELFDGNQRSHRLAAARAREQAAAAQLEEARNQADLRLEQARLRAEEARSRLATARVAVSEAEESLALLRQRFASGLAPLTDLLGVQAALDRARWDLLRAENELVTTLGRGLFERGLFVQTLLPQEEVRP